MDPDEGTFPIVAKEDRAKSLRGRRFKARKLAREAASHDVSFAIIRTYQVYPMVAKQPVRWAFKPVVSSSKRLFDAVGRLHAL